MNKLITSKDNPHIKEIASLSSSSPYFLVEGYHLVEEAIAHHYAKEVFTIKEETYSVTTFTVSEAVMKKLTKTVTPEGIVALCEKPREKEEFGEKVLYLDRVQDPGNVGTLLRTALAFSFTDVVFSEGSNNPYSHKSLMASQGALFSLSLHFDKEMRLLQKLKADGYHLICTSLEGKEVFPEFPKKKVLILGNEGQGVKEEVSKMSSSLIRLPIKGIDSLNVAIAGGIFMYLLRD